MKRRAIAVLLALVMVLALTVPALAVEEQGGPVELNGVKISQAVKTEEASPSIIYSDDGGLFDPIPVYEAPVDVRLSFYDAGDGRSAVPSWIRCVNSVVKLGYDVEGYNNVYDVNMVEAEIVWMVTGEELVEAGEGVPADVVFPEDLAGLWYVEVYWDLGNSFRSEEFFLKVVSENEPEQPETPAITFTDVPAGRYFTAPVAWAVEQGITDGAGNNQFLPGRTCTNGEIITFLWRAAGELKASQAAPITAKYAGFADAINWAYEQGIIDSSFQETADCTRANTVTYIWKAKSSPAASGSNDFTDIPAGADYIQAVNWAVGTKVTDGTGNGSTFSPNDTCTRGEIVTFLYRAFAE